MKLRPTPLMDLQETFIQVVSTYDVNKKPKKSSLIAPWLGIERTPRGMSQRIGFYLEDLFAADMGKKNILPLTDYKQGRNYMITYEGNHQVDMLAKPSEMVIHRELKTNTDLDNGKKRDTLRREESICSWMGEKGWTYDSGCFCPFFYNKGRHVSGLGWVDGLEWYIETFEPSWTMDDFKALGKSAAVHKAIGLS